jgi:hypothetical protein
MLNGIDEKATSSCGDSEHTGTDRDGIRDLRNAGGELGG